MTLLRVVAVDLGSLRERDPFGAIWLSDADAEAPGTVVLKQVYLAQDP